jgi:hypothetical protein
MSALFFSLLCWDMAGDRLGWRRASWAPIAVASVPACLRICFYFHHVLLLDHSTKESGVAAVAGAGAGASEDDVANPLYVHSNSHSNSISDSSPDFTATDKGTELTSPRV